MITHPHRNPITGRVEQLATPSGMLPSLDANGFLVCWVPDYSRPGVAEQVDRDAFDAELAGSPPTSNVGQLLTFARVARFEREMVRKYPKA